MQALLPAVGTIDLGSLIQLGVDIGDGGQIDDRAPAHCLPDTDENIAEQPPGVLLQEGDRAFTGIGDQRVDNAGVRGEHCVGRGADDDPGQEVRQIQQCLGNTLEPPDADLVEQQRQNDWHREAEQKIQHIQQQRVGNSLTEIAVLKDLFKNLQPDKFTACIALADLVVQKSDRQACVSKVLEHDDECHGQQHQCVQLPVTLEVVQKSFLLDGYCIRREHFAFALSHRKTRSSRIS